VLRGAPLVKAVLRNLQHAVGDKAQSDHLHAVAQRSDHGLGLRAHAHADGAELAHLLLVFTCLEVGTAPEHVRADKETDVGLRAELGVLAGADPGGVQRRTWRFELTREQRHHLARAERKEIVERDDIAIVELLDGCPYRAGEDELLHAEQMQEFDLHAHHQAHRRVERVLVHVNAPAQRQNALGRRTTALGIWVFHLPDLDAALMSIELIELLEAIDFDELHRLQNLESKMIGPARAKHNCRVEAVFHAQPKGLTQVVEYLMEVSRVFRLSHMKPPVVGVTRSCQK
jgi:hypothetical protein